MKIRDQQSRPNCNLFRIKCSKLKTHTAEEEIKNKKKQNKLLLNAHTGWAKLSDTTLHFCL